MRKIKIVSRKYDGSLRDEHEAFLCAEDDDSITVYAPPGTLDYDHRKRAWFRAPDGLLELYFKTRWYTVHHICEQNSYVNQSYIHLSMPAVVTTAGIEWIDLDLDYRVHLDGSLEILDEHEYEVHRQTMRYTAEMHFQVQQACTEAETLYRKRAYPFDYNEQLRRYEQIKAGT